MIIKDLAEYEETDSQLAKYTIANLHNEIERLKTDYQQANDIIVEQSKEIERLNNIINKTIEEIEKDRKKDYNDLVKKSFYCNKTDKLLGILNGDDKE